MRTDASPQKIVMPQHDQLDKLIVDVVHKMKNNLGGITGFASLLERDVGAETPEGKLVEQIKTSALRLDDLLLDLMTLIRRMHISKETLCLFPVLHQKSVAYEDESKRRCPILNQTECSEKDVLVQSDPIYLDRLINSVVTFVVKSQARLAQIVLSRIESGPFCLAFCIRNMDLDFSESDDFSDLINRHEPVEAKLAFFSAVKLAEQLNCDVFVKPIGQKELDIQVVFKQEWISWATI